MGKFRTALAALQVLQAGLTITDPVTASIKRVYPYVPKALSTVPDGHSWITRWELTQHQRQPSRRYDLYTVTTELAVHEADLDRAAAIATAFHEAFLVALDANITLGGAIVTHNVRGQLADVAWGGSVFPGLREILILEIAESTTFG